MIYRFNAISIKIPMGILLLFFIFAKMEKLILNMELQGAQNIQNNIGGGGKLEDSHFLISELSTKPHSNQNSEGTN